MTLNFQNVLFPFGQGIDTKDHPLYVPIGKLTELENAVFTQTGSLSKRNGYSRFSNQILSSVNLLETAIGSAVYNDTDLLLLDGYNIYSWFSGYDKWVNRGACTIVNSSFRYIDSAFKKQTSADLAVAQGLEIVAWTDTYTNEVKYSIVDLKTQAKLATDLPINTQNTVSQSPRCFVFGVFLCVAFATDDGRVQVAVISPSNPTIPAVFTVASNCGDAIYELLVFTDTEREDPNVLIVSYKKDDGDSIITALYDSNFNQLKSYTTSGLGDIKNLTVYHFSGYYGIAYSQLNVTGVTGYLKTFSLGNITELVNFSNASSIYQIDSISFDYFRNIAVIQDESETVHFYYDTPNETSAPYINHNTLSSNFTVGESETFKYYANLYTKPFIYQNKIYLAVISQPLNNTNGLDAVNLTNLQPTYFLVDQDGNTKSKLHSGVSATRKSTLLANIAPIPESLNVQYHLINDQEDELQNNQLDDLIVSSFESSRQITTNYVRFAAGILTPVPDNEHVTEATFTFSSSFTSAELNGSLYLTGGIVQEYDGARVVEQGFNIFPENCRGNVTSDGYVAAGIYSYQFTYEWIDTQGKIEISAPSPPVQIEVLTPSALAWDIPNLTFSNKQNVRIGVYRTQAASSGDPLFYKVGTTDILIDSYITTFIDNVPDEGIRSNEILYCTSDSSGSQVQLENISAPTATLITTYKNRVFLAGTENPNQVWYSKTVQPGEAVNFNEVLTFNLDPKGGPITALGSLNNSLVIFKRNAIYIIAGQGANNTGAENDFTDPQLVSSDCGCINPQSLVLTSQGLFFQSTKGIYLLGVAGSPSYVGAPVETFNSLRITAAAQIPDTSQIRFTYSEGTTLVYDYEYDQWSTFTNQKAVSGGVWNNLFYFVAPNGRVYQETIGEYLDHTTPIQMSLTTGWLSFAGIQGYQKVNSFLISGDYYGPHILTMDLAFDGNPNYSQTKQIDTASFINPNVYGEQNVYGSNSPYGGSFYREQMRVFVNQQRSQRLRLKIQELNTEGNRGLDLLALTFKVGSKQGLGKVAAKAQF